MEGVRLFLILLKSLQSSIKAGSHYAANQLYFCRETGYFLSLHCCGPLLFSSNLQATGLNKALRENSNRSVPPLITENNLNASKERKISRHQCQQQLQSSHVSGKNILKLQIWEIRFKFQATLLSLSLWDERPFLLN